MRRQRESSRWHARPGRAACIRIAIFVAPIAASIAFVHFASKVVPMPTGSLWLFLLWWGGISAGATLVLMGIDRFARRLLPLAALYKLSLVFPDRAPSRMKTAMQTGTVETLEQRLDGEVETKQETPGEAAQRLLALVAQLDSHDALTRGHSERVRAYSRMIGEELHLSEQDLDLLNWAALMHDVGKLDVAQEILTKPGKPTEEEWESLRLHPVYGAQHVEPLREWLGEWTRAVTQHHERWDGQGYPAGLEGKDISLAGRIVAVADVFDVITSARSYKSASQAVQAREEIARCAGSQFDPSVVRAFLGVSLGRLRFAMGPLSWLAHLPILGRMPLTPAVSTAWSSAAAVVASVTTGIAGDGAAKLPPVVDDARAAPARVASTPPRPAGAPAPALRAPLLRRAMDEDSVTVIQIPGAPALVRIQAAPAVGRAEALRGSAIRFTPPPDFHGSVAIGYRSCQTALACGRNTIQVEVRPVNDGPSAADDLVRGAEDSPLIVDALANDTDVDGDTLAISRATASVGTVEIRGQRLQFTPPADYSGPAALSYAAVDPDGAASEARVTVDVEERNDAPAAADDAATVRENGSVLVDVLENDRDPEGDALSLLDADVAAGGGTVTLLGDTVRFQPAPDYAGTATVRYRVGDGNGGTATALVRLTVVGINTAPSFVPGGVVTLLEDAARTQVQWATQISPGPADEAGQRVSFRVAASPGDLFGADGLPALGPAGVLSLRPAADANGELRTSVQAFDDGGTDAGGDDASDTVPLVVRVQPVNDAPSIEVGPDQRVTWAAGAQAATGWLRTRSAGPPDERAQQVQLELSVDDASLFAPGGLPLVDDTGALTFTPAAGTQGSATVTVRPRDAGGTANGGVDTGAARSFTITVVPVNSAPRFTAGPDLVLREGSPAQARSGWATGISPGLPAEAGQAIAFDVTTPDTALFAAGGRPALAADGTLTFTPAPNANGTATVTVVATDDGGTADGGVDRSAAQTFTITLTPVNSPPRFTAGADQTVAEDSGARSVAGWASAVDPGAPDESSQTVTFSVTSTNDALFTAGGKPALSAAGALTFTPAANAHGSSTVTVRARDDGGTADGGVDTSAPQTLTITVTPENDAPVAAPDTPTTAEDAPVTFDVLANDSDVDGDTLSVVTHDAPALTGTLTANGGGSFTFAPDANVNGTTSFTYTAGDGRGGTSTATVTITITAAPDAPHAEEDAYNTSTGTALVVASPGVLSNDHDEDGDPLLVETTLVQLPANGTATMAADGSFTYTPAAAFAGVDTFTYRVGDGTGRSDEATVTITVTAVPLVTSVLYLQPTGPSANTWSMTSATPPAVTPVPDTDADGNPGLTIRRSNGSYTQVDTRTYQDWVHPLAAATGINGSVTVRLWSSSPGFSLWWSAHPYVYFEDCAPGGTACVRLADADLHVSNWGGLSGGWREHELNLGSVNRTIAAGRELRIRLLTDHNDIWLATTAAYPSSLSFHPDIPTCPAPGSTTLTATEDAWISQASPLSNMGNDSNLFVRSMLLGERRSLVRFALPAVPVGCSLVDAKLRLLAESPAPGRTIYAERATSAWAENTVTWANQPTLAGTPASATTPGSAAWMEWNVTTQTEALMAGTNHGFVLRDSSPGSLGGAQTQFSSREEPPKEPQLVVTFG